MTTKTQSRTSQAEAAALEYRRLYRLGRYPEADQVARTIEELVGRYNHAGTFRVPPRIRQIMHDDTAS